MPDFDLLRRKPTPPDDTAVAADPAVPSEEPVAEAAAAAEATAGAAATVWVDESWDTTPGDPPGWFRDDALDAPDPAEAPEGAPPVLPVADGTAPPADADVVDEPDPRDAGSDVLASAEASDAAQPLDEPEAVAAAGTAHGAAASLDAADAAAPFDAPDGGDAATVSLPGPAQRTEALLLADAAAAAGPRGRSPFVSVLVGALILVIVGAGGFGIGMLLPPILLPLPAGSSPAASLAPTAPGSSVSPGPIAPASPGVSPGATASAPPPSSVAPTPDPTPVVYVVKRGDQLGRIAKSFGITLQAIMAANNITNANLIVPGQKLVIPSPVPSGAPSPSATP